MTYSGTRSGSAPAYRSRAKAGQASKVAENSGILAVSAGLVGVVSYVCTLLMANMLETTDYTHFAAAAMLMGIVGIVASALVPLPLSHIVAVHPAGSEERRDGMAFAVFVSWAAGAASALLTGGLALVFAGPDLAAAVALGSLGIFVVTAHAGWLQGELRFPWYSLTTIVEVLVRLLFSLVVIALAWGAGGAVAGFAVGSLVQFAVPRSFYRDLTWRPGVLREKWRWAETSDIASVLCVVSVLVGIDVVVVGFLGGGSAEAAGFQALATIAKGPVYVAAGTALVAFPLLRSPGANVRKVLAEAFVSFGQLGTVAFAVIATAPPMMSLLIVPQKYHGSLGLLPWLAAAGLGYAVLMVLTTVLLALRAYRRCQLGLAIACVLVLGGLWAGWEFDGVRGMAIGCGAGAVAAALALAVIARPVLAVHASSGSGRSGFAWAAGVLALLVVLGVAAWLQPVVWLLLAGVGGTGVLAHQRGLLPTRNDLRILRRRRPAGRRSKPQTLSPGRLARIGARLSANTAATFVLVTAAGFGVRALGLERGFELWVDEMLYVRLGESVGAGEFPTLPDGPFFLHPPGYFLLEAGVIKVFGLSGDIIPMTLRLRWLNAVLGAVTVGLGYLLIRKLAGLAAAWLTAVILSFEPFILRNNSHAFLETSAMVPALAGMVLLVGSREWEGRLRSCARLAGAGSLLGYSVVCKDFFLICTIATVLAALAWKKTLPWRQGLVVTGFGIVPYAVYLLVVTVHGHFPAWQWAKSHGVVRMSGVEKSTGFTAEGSPSIVSRLVEQVGQFGTSYLLLVLCPVAGLLLCFSIHAGRRLMGLAGLALGAAGTYSALFGTFEEQYGYGVMVVGALCAVLFVVELRERFPGTRKVLAVIAVVHVLLTVALGLRTALTQDNGFVRADEWIQANLPADARISVTNSTGHFAYMHDPRFGIWPDAPLMEQNGVSYVLTQSKPTRQGYGYANPAMLAWLEEHATPMVTTAGPTNGETTIWYVDPAKRQAAAAANVGVPSKSYGTER
ncbi:oligosaccharide flippase family protein [Paenarthrobacter ureafaciens]|uniref:oligosaccharide flippase family protein n=1 Tax=Paenarthrobacter ureafaciens TaxID=37931 RepID=UPI001C2C7AA5|nr:oligosaccharide flippase family protein [Paenarthrobacter ureafaciens]